MRNLRFRSNATLAIYNNRPRRLRWLLPTLLLVTGTLYGALQMNWGEEHLRAGTTSLGTVALPLELPDNTTSSITTEPDSTSLAIPALAPTTTPKITEEKSRSSGATLTPTSAVETEPDNDSERWL